MLRKQQTQLLTQILDRIDNQNTKNRKKKTWKRIRLADGATVDMRTDLAAKIDRFLSENGMCPKERERDEQEKIREKPRRNLGFKREIELRRRCKKSFFSSFASIDFKYLQDPSFFF